MTWLAPVAGGIAALGGGIAGGLAQKGAADNAKDLANAAAMRAMGIQLPDSSQMQLSLEDLKQIGLLTPEMEQAITQNPSALQNIQEDPRLQKSELDALSQLSGIANAGGMDPQSKAALLQSQISNASAARGARDANLQNAAQRGVSGSGLEFVSNQMADQSGAQANQMAGAQAAADARNREMAALTGMANLGGSIRSQNYNEAANLANSQNDINRFNTQAQQSVANTNVQNKNAAQQYNLQNAQNIANQNVVQRNAAQQYNKQLPEQNFQNQLARTTAANQQTPAAINATMAGGQALANLYGGLGQSALGAGASVYANSQNNNKYKYDPYTGQAI